YGSVTSMTVYEGDLIVGGYFDIAGGEFADGLAAWDGASWTGLVSEMTGEFGGSAVIGDMVEYDGRLYVGGSIGYVDGMVAHNIVAWDGDSWSGLGSGIGNGYSSSEVGALAVMGQVLAVGGDFRQAGGRPSCRFAIYCTEATPVLDDAVARPTVFLEQNHPNPFNPRTRIAYTVPDGGGAVVLRLFDLAGRLVRTLVAGDMPAGRHEAVWDGTDETGRKVASGNYFYRLAAPGVEETRQLVLVR
ncbi:hypothetical protein KKG45_11085, partial [bacterium]|nr:hypothetical protein [bacterium]